MDSLIHSLWWQTALCVAGWLVGWVLHLKWHPLRRHLSDAWDLLTGRPWLSVMLATMWLLAQWLGPESGADDWKHVDVSFWRDAASPLALRGVEMYVSSLHALFPPWPLAVILPPVLTAMAWRLHRLPYRYSQIRLSHVEKVIMWLVAALCWAWIFVEIGREWRALPEWLESVRLAMRTVFSALMMALSQMLLIRMAIDWDDPASPDQNGDFTQALEETAARWRGVLGLAALDLLWLLWHQHQDISGAHFFHRWVIVEAMWIFAPLPIAMAARPGPLLRQGAWAMRILLRAWLPLLGLTITAGAILMLLVYSGEILRELLGNNPLMGKAFASLRALVLATVHSWLFLASVFTLIRHGLKPPPESGSAD